MDDLDRRLRDAGTRWRVSQPSPPDIDALALSAGRSRLGWPVAAAARAIVAGATLIAVLALAIWTQMGDPRIGTGIGTEGPDSSARGNQALADGCAVTRPDPPLNAPAPYPSSPPDNRYAWFGTPELWTMLDLDGEVWNAGNTSFPVAVKVFWWSSSWAGMKDDQQPALTVIATRLDGLEAVTTDHATNASADSLGGEAMLVGIEFPTPGCWQLTAQYGDAALSHVVWITDK